MKRLLGLCAMAAVMAGLLATGATAQDRPPREGPTGAGPAGAGPGSTTGPASRPGGDREAMLNRAIDDLQLTADQAAKVRQVLQTFRQSAEKWRKEHGQEMKDAQDKMAAARRSGNEDDAKAAREAMDKLQAGQRELQEGVRKQLADIPLAADQVEKIVRALAAPPPPRPGQRLMALLRGVDLSKEQMDSIRKIAEQAQADSEKAADPKAKEDLAKAAMDKIRADVLTDAQRKELAQLEKISQSVDERIAFIFAGLKVTDEQIPKIKAVWDEAMKNADQSGNRREAMQEAIKKIGDEVLTPDQRDQLQKNVEKALPPPPPGGGREPGAGGGPGAGPGSRPAGTGPLGGK